MRSRLLAIIILFLLVVLPGIAYWYFFYANTSSITFQSTEKGLAFDVSLEGKLEYTYLPLADKVLVFHQTCQETCTIVIPPAKYTFSLTASGKENISDNITMTLGQKQNYRADFTNAFVYSPITGENIDTTLESSLLANAMNSFSGSFQSIGTGKGGKYFVLRTLDRISEIGILTADRFVSISSLPFQPESIALDISRRYIVLQRGSADQYIISLDGHESIAFPYDDSIELVDHTNSWKIKTKNGVYGFEYGNWQKNPRFTDYIDISPSLRIGYIDASDSAKLSLQNLKENTSYIISLERNTGIAQILKTGLNIQGFLFHDGSPAFLDTEGRVNEMQIQD